MAPAPRGLLTFVGKRPWLCALAASIAMCAAPLPALAQSVPPPATQNSIDGNGVDLVSGAFFLASPTASVGQPGSGGLVYQRSYDSSIQDWRDNVTGTINANGTAFTVTLLGASETFTQSGSTYTSNEGRGGTLTFASNVYTYTSASGVVALYDKALASTQPTQANEGRVTQMTMPSGERLTFTYTQLSASPFLAHRLQSVNNNLGYQLSFQYASNTADALGLQLVQVMAINNAIDYCAPTANGCSGYTRPWMGLTFGYGSGFQTVTDAIGRTMRYTITSNRITGVRWPSSGSDNVTITYDANGLVYQVANGIGTWTYLREDNGAVRQTSVVDPASHVRLFFSNLNISRITAFQNGVGDAQQFAYDSLGRLQTVFEDLGNYTGYQYDSRGNVTGANELQNSLGGVPGSTISHGAASYAASCTNPVTCNLPTSTADGLGNTTNFTYDSTHGGVLTVTAPDPDGGGALPRPQTRYTYAQVTASYIQSSGGSPIAAPSSVWRLTQISSCATSTWNGTACSAGAGDETRTTITYGTNNQLPSQVSSGAGDGSLTSTAASTYDDVGNVLTVDGPLSGSNDTTRVRYDYARQRIGVIGPDPDGAGSLKHRAARFTYNTDGQVVAVEQGTVDSQSETHWTAFSSLETMSMAYDSVGRRVRESLVVGGVTQALVQYGYDNANKIECTVVRMNIAPSVIASLPGACSLSTQGANGPDRITRNVYDNADRVIAVQSAYGTAQQQTTLTQTFTPNGEVATLTDANGNVTAYEYDGVDRLIKTRFPNASGGGSSTSDYEQFTYNGNSLVTQRRLRDGGLVNFTYDNLSRVTFADAPSGTSDMTRAYDNFSRLTQTAYAGAHTLSFAYDQLSRNTGVTRVADSATHTVSYQYDAAGRRTRITWPDAFYAQYDYDVTSALTAIRENGAASGVGVLATYAYDNLGRRTSISRGNGATTTYGFDAASRLSSLQQDLSGSTYDQTLGFSYNAAGQALTRTGVNSQYNWTQPAISAVNYAPNGRNQYASVGGTNVSYDARGNLTSTGAASFGYDAFNRLTSAGSATLFYDPAGRLYQTTSNGSTVTARFLYDGLDAIAEYNGSNALLRRYVHGPGMDEPLVWYEGADTTDRRWLMQDQLGSVIAATDASGAIVGTPNTYDDYGQPGASNTGRFQYTGQMWIGEASLYHYKARAYLPALGRFAQTDPIGYAGGMNLYAYVENNPVNFTDPNGMRVYLVSRRAVGLGPFDLGRHLYVVVVPDNGDPTRLFSYGPSIDNAVAIGLGEALLVPSADSNHPTLEGDWNSWNEREWVDAYELNYSDDEVIAAGAATDQLVRNARCMYDFLAIKGCNSNGGVRALLAHLGFPATRDPGNWAFSPGWNNWWRLFDALPSGTLEEDCSDPEHCVTTFERGARSGAAGGRIFGGIAGSAPTPGAGSLCGRMPNCDRRRSK